jgi:hypothetical protein
MVEVGHDNTHAITLSADDVRHRNLDIVKLDIGGATGHLASDLKAAHCDAGVAFERHDENR